MKKILGFALCLALVLGAVAGCGNAAKEYQKEAIALYNDGLEFYKSESDALAKAENKDDVQKISDDVAKFSADFDSKLSDLQKKYTDKKVDVTAALSDDLTTAATGYADAVQDFADALTAKTAEFASEHTAK